MNVKKATINTIVVVITVLILLFAFYAPKEHLYSPERFVLRTNGTSPLTTSLANQTHRSETNSPVPEPHTNSIGDTMLY